MSDLVELAREIARRRAIAFVGAGLSQALGYPSWDGLLDAFASEVVKRNPEEAQGLDRIRRSFADDLPWLAECYQAALGDREFRTVFRALMEGRDRKPGDLHRHLVSMPFRHFVTTNYDTSLESAHRERFSEEAKSVTWDEVESVLADFGSPESVRRYIHLHGTDTWQAVLTEGQYRDLYERSETTLRLHALFSTHSVVFMGFSLKDPDLMHVLRKIRYLEKAGSRHYAFLPAPPDLDRQSEQRRFRELYGIHTLFYDQAQDDHSQFTENVLKLKRLIDQALKHSSAPAGKQAPKKHLAEQIAEAVYRGRQGLGHQVEVLTGRSEASLSRLIIDVMEDPVRKSDVLIRIGPEDLGIVVRQPGERLGKFDVTSSICAHIAGAIGQPSLANQIRTSALVDAVHALLGGRVVLLVFDCFDRILEHCGNEYLLARFFRKLPAGCFALVADRSGQTLAKLKAAKIQLHHSDVPLTPDLADPPVCGLAEMSCTCRDLVPWLAVIGQRLPIGSLQLFVPLSRSVLERGITEIRSKGWLQERDCLLLTVSARDQIFAETANDQILDATLWKLIRRCVRFIEERPNWEYEPHQNSELVQYLVLFRCAFSLAIERGFDDHSTYQLGTRLGYLLHIVGRWADAIFLQEWIVAHVDKSRSIQPRLLLARSLIRQANSSGRLGPAYESARKSISEVESVLKSEVDPLRQSEALAHYYMRLGQLLTWTFPDESRKHLVTAIELSRERFPKVHVDAAGYLSELALTSTPESREEDLQRALIVLDEAVPTIRALNAVRVGAHHERVRGNIELALGRTLQARRAFACALVGSIQWPDARLRGSALIGLARCDWDKQAAKEAVEIFERQGMTGQRDEARDVEATIDERRVARPQPVIFLIGPPASGKSTVRSVVAEHLISWGYDVIDVGIQDVHEQQCPNVRSKDYEYDSFGRLCFSELARDRLVEEGRRGLADRINGIGEAAGAVVELTCGPDLAQALEVFDDRIVRRSLCFVLFASGAERELRNSQRGIDQLPTGGMSALRDACAPSEGALEKLERRGAFVVSLRSDDSVGIWALRQTVLRDLALVYKPWPELDSGYRSNSWSHLDTSSSS